MRQVSVQEGFYYKFSSFVTTEINYFPKQLQLWKGLLLRGEQVRSQMGISTITPFIPSKPGPSVFGQNTSLLPFRRKPRNKILTFSPEARLFGPSIFEASKLKVLILGVDEKKHPGKLPRTYTLTHSDITSKLTLAISQTINNSQLQGWSNKLYRDEVVAQWKKVKGKMSLHVHCHVCGDHFLFEICSRLRYYIFCKELPVVLKAFVHGDGNLLNNYPELREALVWVYFHSSVAEFNKVECWGPLKDATAPNEEQKKETSVPDPCHVDCSCCFPPISLITWSRLCGKSKGTPPKTKHQ